MKHLTEFILIFIPHKFEMLTVLEEKLKNHSLIRILIPIFG